MRNLHSSRYLLWLRNNQTVLATGVGLIAAALWFLANKDTLQLITVSESARQRYVATIVTRSQDFMTLMLGMLVEALPFIILGVGISVAVQLFTISDKLLARLPKQRVLRGFMLSFAGMAMPVCECGNVPVARSLMIKGLSPRDTIVFLLSAPSINIVTLLATWEAFSTQRSMAFWRAGMTLLLANLTASIVARLLTIRQTLTEDFVQICEQDHHNHAPSWHRAVALFRTDLWQVTRLLIFGSTIAAATQIIVPRQTMVAFASNPVLAVLAMLLLAFVISICSSVDAFFALAYAHLFGFGPLLAFLLAGPMVDIKMLALLKSTFTIRALALITTSVGLGALFIGIGVGLVY